VVLKLNMNAEFRASSSPKENGNHAWTWMDTDAEGGGRDFNRRFSPIHADFQMRGTWRRFAGADGDGV
jgi:hypothetical protein